MAKNTKPRRWSGRKLEAFLDEVKDAIDKLHEIAHEKQRKEAAKELLEYIELHHEP